MDSLGIDFSAGVKRGTAATDIFCPVHPAGLKFGFRASFGPRISAFGFMPYQPFPSLFRAALGLKAASCFAVAFFS
jgi:hypothetical protein